jgi:hypothetical protein
MIFYFIILIATFQVLLYAHFIFFFIPHICFTFHQINLSSLQIILINVNVINLKH